MLGGFNALVYTSVTDLAVMYFAIRLECVGECDHCLTVVRLLAGFNTQVNVTVVSQ